MQKALDIFTKECDRPGCGRVTDLAAPFCCYPCRVAHHFDVVGPHDADHSEVCALRRQQGQICHRAGETNKCHRADCHARIPLDRKYCCNACRKYELAGQRREKRPATLRHDAGCPLLS